MELGAIADAHKVAVPHGLEVQTPELDLESGREGVRAAHGVPLAPVLGADHHRDGCRRADLQCEGPCLARQLSGFATAGSKFLLIMRRARMVSSGDNGVYTGSGLRGVIPYVQCVADVFLSQVCSYTSLSGEGVRSQVPREGLRSYGGLTLITFALLSLL
jgi:hypothetical protein